MPELTKKHPIENVELHFLGPASNQTKAIEVLKHLGFIDTSDSVPWREAFPYTRKQLPGVALAGARYREELTQRQLSNLTSIPQRHISEMENGKRSIGKERAKKLAKALDVDYRVFL